MKNLVIKSYAKINLCLNVVGKREDGYHNLDMVMLPLELHDSILFTELKNAPDHYVTIDDFSLGLFKYNTATNAINLLQEKYGFTNRFRVSIHKVIPMQAGLGGGSSNAATVINAVDKYLNLNMSVQEKIDIAVQVGADVPFFISSKPARCRGVGEKIDFINLKNDYYVLIVKPVMGCSTEKIFKLDLSKESLKAINLLNQPLLNKLFTDKKIPSDEILLIYYIYFQLINNDLSKEKNKEIFWEKTCNYFIKETKGKTGDFLLKNIQENLDLSPQNIYKIIHIVEGKVNIISPSYFSKICGTTGLFVFFIKDILDFLGITNSKKICDNCLWTCEKMINVIEEKINMINIYSSH